MATSFNPDKLPAGISGKSPLRGFLRTFPDAPIGLVELDPKTGKILWVNDFLVELSGYSREEQLAMDVPVFFDKGSRELFLNNLQEIQSSGQVPPPQVFRTFRKDGEIRWCLVFAAMDRIEGGEDLLQCLIVDQTPIYQAQLEAENKEQKLHQLRSILDRTLSFDNNFPDPPDAEANSRGIISFYSQFAKILDGVDSAVYVTDMDTHEILFINQKMFNIFGDVKGQICWQTFFDDKEGPCEFCTNKYLLDEEGKATGIYTWEFFNEKSGGWWECRDRAIKWVDGRLVRMEVATPISGRKQQEERVKWEREYLEKKVLQRTADLKAINERLVREITERKITERRLIEREAELKRLYADTVQNREKLMRSVSRDLHDDITQRLALLSSKCLGCIDEAQNEKGPSIHKMEEVTREMMDLTVDVQNLSRNLHPSVIDHFGLSEALRKEIAAYQESQKTKINYTVKDFPKRLDYDTALCFYRIAQESLRNISKHANSKKIDICLTKKSGNLNLEIRDYGKGFERSGNGGSPNGLGLTSMKERLDLIGGTFSIWSRPGRGTKVSVCAPLKLQGMLNEKEKNTLSRRP